MNEQQNEWADFTYCFPVSIIEIEQKCRLAPSINELKNMAYFIS